MTMMEISSPMKAPIDDRDVKRFTKGIPGISAAGCEPSGRIYESRQSSGISANGRKTLCGLACSCEKH